MKLTFLTAIGAVLLAAPAFGQGVPLQAHLTGPVQPVVKFEIVGKTIPKPLTDQPGDPVRGKRVVTDATNGTCLICHVMPALPEEPNHGNIAPPLEGVGSRLSSRPMLRLCGWKSVGMSAGPKPLGA